MGWAEPQADIPPKDLGCPLPVAWKSLKNTAGKASGGDALEDQIAFTKGSQDAATKAQGNHYPQVSTGQGQQTWQEIQQLLTPKVLNLERTKPCFEEILTDGRITCELLETTFYIQNAKSVIFRLCTLGKRFKIGITNDPGERYYKAHYAYNTKRYREKDRCDYEGMIVIFVHQYRDVIAMMEHALIVHFLSIVPDKCCNRKTDAEKHKDINDQSSVDEDDYDAAGPHFLYIAFGPPLYR